MKVPRSIRLPSASTSAGARSQPQPPTGLPVLMEREVQICADHFIVTVASSEQCPLRLRGFLLLRSDDCDDYCGMVTASRGSRPPGLRLGPRKVRGLGHDELKI